MTCSSTGGRRNDRGLEPPGGYGSVDMNLTKHHGLGNDFLVAMSTSDLPCRPDAAVARGLCDRHTGIGADGFLWGLPPTGAHADLRMVLHNADGSEAEISGNGIRCLAQAFLRTVGRDTATVRIETAAGLRVIESRGTDDRDVLWMSVDMGEVVVGPSEPPKLSAELDQRFGTRHGTFSIGNPHLVITVGDLDSIDIRAEGPRLESAFIGGINVHFLEYIGADHLRLLHWERGAGATLACGSGASVSAVAARRWGLSGDEVALELPGGRAQVTISGYDRVTLSGPATYVGAVAVP